MTHHRSRKVITVLLIVIVAAGLGSRTSSAEVLPRFVTTYAGDTLWGLMFFLLAAWVRPGWTSGRLAVVALVITLGIEFSQLYHAPAIDRFRATPLGRLTIGNAFLWTDVVCCTIGVAVGLMVDSLWWRSRVWARPDIGGEHRND